jgi:hypothetical protein
VKRLLNKLIDAGSQVCFDLLILFSKPSGKNNKQLGGREKLRGAQNTYTHKTALLLPREGVGFQNISFTACKVLPNVSVRITACFSECATAFYWYAHANTSGNDQNFQTFAAQAVNNWEKCNLGIVFKYITKLSFFGVELKHDTTKIQA